MGRRLERWRWCQLELLTPPSGHLRKPAGVYGRRRIDQGTRLMYPAFLAGIPDAPGQLGWRPFRPLGNLQRRVLTLPRPRKRSAARFGAFRPFGNVQRRVLELSEPSETFSGAFWSFPRPRKRSAACFDTFRALGASADAGESIRVHVGCTRPAWLASLTPRLLVFSCLIPPTPSARNVGDRRATCHDVRRNPPVDPRQCGRC